MSPDQQFEGKKFIQTNHWEYFPYLSIAMYKGSNPNIAMYKRSNPNIVIYKWSNPNIVIYKRSNPNMPNVRISQVGYSLCLTYYWIFIELCTIIQQKRQRPDATTYSRRRTNIIFYRPAKTILCIWRVGKRIFQ